MSAPKATTIKNKKIFLDNFRRTFGNISLAAQASGINRCTYHDWMKKDPDFRRQAEEIDEGTGDFVESKLLKLINEDNVAGIIFFCKTKLKHRGYTERTELVGKDEEPLAAQNIQIGKESIKTLITEIRNEF